jgi:hypothetical protein
MQFRYPIVKNKIWLSDFTDGKCTIGSGDIEIAINAPLEVAKIISAAPDLLNALKGMLEYFCESGIDDYSDTETVQAARLAILKATQE